MALQSSIISSLILALILLYFPLIRGQVVPALFIFGDSVVDAGNNNDLPTIVKANFPPYRRDFNTANNNNNTPTGRFSNGRLTIDFVAERSLGFSSSPPAYLSSEATERNLLTGVNFASAGSGYYEPTAILYHAIPLSQQLENYRVYQERLEELIGIDNATTRFSLGIHVISTGNSDFLQNYYIDPLLRANYTPAEFSNILIRNYARFVQELYTLGARRIGVTSLPPIGCLPAAITLFGSGNNMCVNRLNYDARSFNTKLNLFTQRLRRRLSDLRIVVFDVYQPLYDIITNPVEHGFAEARKGCCGTGLLETAILCNPVSIGTCTNASEYVFWDSFHPSEAVNSILADSMTNPGQTLIFN